MTLVPDELINQTELPGELYFPEGLPGFEDCRHYKLQPVEDMPFYSMICEENEAVGFIVTSPWFWIQGFEVELPDDVCEKIGITSPEEAEVLAIVTVRDPLDASTMNLAAPVAVSLKRRQAAQVVLTSPEWSTRVPLKGEGVAASVGLG
ncbi:flagellar assembly protein FliW [Acidaminobacter hydrogenoformans]|uniref:Flagellar assembly factor FliW n=1 Tax=Acidaminobacter hydrogenoformans DSM 2784 TaxID=1120920 RepID=A0A1G5RUU1_9FIRM|nr:flagellar assembly protein FliW [Acidaminobacter hydrogenoformans]SCZ77823.1 flagellar assembly factor FliW [Acidaminobacter hydrogenoformans DSM 2784]